MSNNCHMTFSISTMAARSDHFAQSFHYHTKAQTGQYINLRYFFQHSNISARTYTLAQFIHTYTYMYMYDCICMCLCT